MNFKNKKFFLIKFFILLSLLFSHFSVKAQETITLNSPIAGCFGSNAYVNLSWTTISGSPTYFILRRAAGEVATSTIASTTNNAYLDETVLSDKNYFYQIKAVRGSDTFYSNVGQSSATYCPPVLSVQISCQVDGPHADLTWTAVSGNLSTYEVYRDSTKITTTANTSFSDGPALEATKNYNYFVKAIWQSGVSTTSEPVSIIIPACPPTLTGSLGCLGNDPGGPSISLSWNSLLGVQNYQIYRKAQQDADFSLLGTVTTTIYTDNLTESLTNYWQSGNISYFVKANWQTAQSDSLIIADSVPRCPPFLKIQTNCDELSYRLYWTATRDASAYNIYKEGEYYAQVIGVTSTSFADTICTDRICTTTYQVVASAPGEMLPSNSVTKFVDCETVIPPSPAPVLDTPSAHCSAGDSIVALGWTPSDNVSYYSVIRNGLEIAKITQTSYDDSAVQSGYDYTYFIIAYGRGGTSTTSENAVTITALDCTPPTTPTLTLGRGCSSGYPYITLSWTNAGNVFSYDVYKGTSQANLFLTATFLKGTPEFTNRSWTDTVVSTSTTYYYKIVANGPVGVSPASSTVKSIASLSCNPTAPWIYWLDPSCVSGNPRVSLSWSTDGANTHHFEIFRTGWDGPVIINDPSIRSYIDNSVSHSTNYQYRVDAVGFVAGQRVSSGSSSVTTYDCTAPGPFALAEPSIFCQDGYPRATLSWTTSTNATSYDLYRYFIKPDGTTGTTSIVYSVASPYTDFGLGKALNFDGSNDYARVPNSSYLQITGDLTISFWAYPTNVSKGRQNPLGKAYGGEFNLTMETSGRLSYYHGSAGENDSPFMSCSAWGIFSSNRLVHVTIVRDISTQTVTIYKNGIAQTTNCSGWIDPSPSNGDLRIGYEYAGFWQGWLDEIRIYNRALTPGEVSSLFNGVDISDGLRGLWHLDEGSGQIFSDSNFDSNYLNNGIRGSTEGSDGNDPSWIENGLQSDQKYMWRVRANGPGGSIFSNTTTPNTLPLCPPTKAGLRLTAFCDATTSLPGVNVSWSFSTNATIYEIYRQDKGLIATTSQSVNPAQRVFIDDNEGAGLSENTSYTYWVKSINSAGQTDSAHLTIITPVCSLPTTPQNVTSSFECWGALPRVIISWFDSNYTDYYRIYRNDGWISDMIDDTDTPTYIYYDTAVRTNSSYTYVIRAFGPGGRSPFSDPTSITTGFCLPLTPSIEFLTTDCQSNSPFNQIYWSDPDFEARVIFYDDFETGDFSKWSGTLEDDGITSVESADPYLGIYHSQFVLDPASDWDGYGGSYYNIPWWEGTHTELYSRVYYKFDTLPANGYHFGFSSMLAENWDNRSGVSLVNEGGQYFWQLYFNNTTTNSMPFVPQINKWYSIELYTKVGTTDGEARFWVDGELKATISERDVSQDSEITQVRASVYVSGPPGTQRTFKIDSVIVSDTYIGPSNPIYNTNQYKIYRNTTGVAPTESDLIKTINSNEIEFVSHTWKDNVNLNQETTYYYWVKSIGPIGESSLSSPSQISTYFCGVPPTPTLTLENLFCQENLPYATLKWTTSSNAYSYHLYRTNPDNSLSTYPTRFPPLTDRGSFSLKFDGVDDYVRVENSPSLNNFDNGLTVEAWGKQTSYTSRRDSWLLDKDYTGYRIWGEDRLKFAVRTPNQNWIELGDDVANRPTLNQWYHVVGVVDNTQLKVYLYVNGQLNSTADLPEKYNFDNYNNRLTFGKHSGMSYFWPGVISDVRIYGRVLSSNEVQERYQGIYKNEAEMRGAWHFEEGRGGEIFDHSGKGNHGLLVNGPSWISGGKIDGALKFDGTNDYVNVPDSPSLAITNAPLSIFAWIKVEEGANQTGWVIAKNSNAATNVQYGMFWRPTDNRMEVYLEGAVRARGATNSILPGNWYFVGFIWDGTDVKIYVNGVQSGSTKTYSGYLTNQPNFRIGRRESSSYHFFGIIDEARIYARALNQSEISNLYNGNEIDATELRALWHFNEGNGTTLYDASPNNNHGTFPRVAEWVSDSPSIIYVAPLEREKTYKFYVKAIGVNTESSASNEVAFTAPACLPATPNLVVTPHCEITNPQLILSWQADTNTEYWSVYKRRAEESLFTFLTDTTLTSYTDGNLESGAGYEYYLTAVGKGVSTNSDAVSETAPTCQARPYNGIPFPIAATSVCYGYDSRMEIEWPSDGTGNTLSYNIWRRNLTQGESDFSTIVIGLGPTATRYVDLIDQLYEGDDFQYKVEAIGSGAGNTLFSQTSSQITAYPCHSATPGLSTLTLVSIQSTADLRMVRLKWTDAGNEEYYQIWRSGSDYEMIATTTGEVGDKEWFDSSQVRILEDGKTYYYKIIPVNVNGSGPESNIEEAQIPIAAPGEFTLSGQKFIGTIHLTWTLAATTTAGGPATYRVLRSNSEDFIVSTLICDNILETQPLECNDTSPTYPERYYVAVARNLSPEETYSNVWLATLPLPKWKEIAPY